MQRMALFCGETQIPMIYLCVAKEVIQICQIVLLVPV